MSAAKLDATSAKTHQLEAQIQRFRGEDHAKRDDDEDDGKKRGGVTSLLVAAHEAVTSLEDDLDTLRQRLNPVIDQTLKDGAEDKNDEGDSVAPAIRQLERLVRRIESTGAAVRFLTHNARI